MTRCAFCRTMRAANHSPFCSAQCRERAESEGCHDAREHSLRLLGSHIVDPAYYAGVRLHGGHSTLEAMGVVSGGRKSTDSKGKM